MIYEEKKLEVHLFTDEGSTCFIFRVMFVLMCKTYSTDRQYLRLRL
jgi:hypothetical protein